VIILQCQKVENNYQRAETSLVLIVHHGVFCNALIQVVVTGFFFYRRST
jgi:DNA-binding protein YbaB